MMSETATADFGEILNDGLTDVDVDAEETVETAPDAEPAETAGIPRDEHGRFAPRTQAEADAVAATEPAPVPQAFAYRAMGETRTWEGVTVDAQGNAVVPAAKVGELRAALNAQVLAQGEYIPLIDRYKQEAAHYKQAAEQRSLSEQKYETMASQLSALLMEGDEATAIEKFFELRGAFPSMMSQAEVQYWKDQATRGTAQPETADSPYREEHYPMPEPEAALATTLDKMEYLKFDPSYSDLTAADWKQLEAAHTRTPLAFIRPATAEEAEQYGVRPKQPVFDERAYSEYVAEFAAMKRSGARIAKSATEAAKFNARQTTPPASARAPRTTATAVAAAAPANGRQQSDKAFRDWMKRPGLDFDDDE